jgi:L-lactate permease
MQARIEVEVGFPRGSGCSIVGATVVQVRWALATIFMILAIAFVMIWSGQTTTLGRFLAGAGPHTPSCLRSSVGSASS